MIKTNGKIDILSSEQICSLQDTLLVETVNYAFERSPYYRKKLSSEGILPLHIKTVQDIGKIPFTTKNDIQNYNQDFFAAQRQDIAEFVSTTGTTGEPVFVALTDNDLDRLSYNEEKSFGFVGADKDDLFLISVTCDNLFIAGMAYYTGLVRRGTSVVRVGPQSIIRHFDLIEKLRPNGIVAVPSFMYHLARRAYERGVEPKSLGIEKIVLIGDSIRNADLSTNVTGTVIEDSFGQICYSTYGITEGQVSFCECHFHRGLHSHPDLVIVEIVDDRGRPLPDGEIGELVITPLQLQAMPLLRYRTGDITYKTTESCPCERNSISIGPILGRKEQKLKVKGVTLYPKTIENALFQIKNIINYQIEAYTGKDKTDHILLRVGTYEQGEPVKIEIAETVKALARVTPEIEITHPKEVEKRLYNGGNRKAEVFYDRRIPHTF